MINKQKFTKLYLYFSEKFNVITIDGLKKHGINSIVSFIGKNSSVIKKRRRDQWKSYMDTRKLFQIKWLR